MKRLKIALICNDDFSMWHFRKDLLIALTSSGFNIYVITPDGPFVSKIKNLGISHIAVPMDRFINPLSDIRLLFLFYQIFCKEKFNIIHTMTIKPNIYGSIAGRLAGRSKIVGLVSGRGYMFSGELGIKSSLLRPLVQAFYRIGLRCSTKIWFQNKDDMSYFIENKYLPESKAVLIKSGGINLDEYSEEYLQSAQLNALRNEFRCNTQTIVITMITARMVWSKGVGDFIKASEILKDKYHYAKFILIGPLDENAPDAVPEKYLKEKESNNCIIKASFRTDIKNLIAASDIIVLPSYYREGVPRVLLEALSMAKPVITTDTVGCREVVEHGKNGYLVPVKDPESLANAIAVLLDNRDALKEFGQYSRVIAEKEFSHTIVIPKIFRDLYQLQDQQTIMKERKTEEMNFHDQLRSGSFGQRWSPELEKSLHLNPMWSNMKYYSVERKSRGVVLDWLSLNCKGKRVLDYCCGNGDDSIIMAHCGAKESIGIDISKKSIENCKKRAVKEKIEDRISFNIMDAEALQFDDNYFDVVNEYGALHHLDLDKSYAEVARVLKPDGKFICTEALGHNPVIHRYRKKTPHLRTMWEAEHILRKKDIMLANKYFEKTEVLGFFHLSTLAAIPFRKMPGFYFLLSILEIVDSVLLTLPLLKWQAWQLVYVLSRPRKIK